MNKIIVTLALMLASSLALAQTWGNQDADAKGGHNPVRAERMQNELDLTDEQVQKMREIRDSGGSREEMQAVLTPEQRVKAMQLRKEHKGEREARKTRMQQELGLTAEQQAKIAQIRKDGGTREEMRAVLTPEQQAKFDAMHKREGKGPRPMSNPANPPATKSAAAAAPSTGSSAATPSGASAASSATTPAASAPAAQTPAAATK